MSKLPAFINEAAAILQSLKSYQYFDFFLVSGRYFDSALLYKGFSLFYPQSTITVQISTQEKSEDIKLKKGELLITSNAYELKVNDKNTSFIKISVAGYFLVFLKSHEGKEEVYRCECHPISENKKQLLNLFSEFQQSCKKEGRISEFRTESLLNLLIADTLDLADGHRQTYYEKGKSRESYNKLAVYLKGNAQLAFDSNQISESLGFSVQYLNSLAHEFRNMSLKELVNFYRLEMTRNLLLDLDLTVAELATQSGFKSAAYFIKLFRQTYGVTPLQCRKKLRIRDSKRIKEYHKVVSFQEILPARELPEIILDLNQFVTLLVINSSPETIVLLWLSPDEPEVEMYRLKSGQRVHLGTGFKECWSVRKSSGEHIAYFPVPETNCQIII